LHDLYLALHAWKTLNIFWHEFTFYRDWYEPDPLKELLFIEPDPIFHIEKEPVYIYYHVKIDFGIYIYIYIYINIYMTLESADAHMKTTYAGSTW